MTRRLRRALVWMAPAMLLAACALAPAEPPMTSSLIDQLPSALPQRPRSAATVLVLRPEARPAYDTTQMAYSLRPHHIAYYARNQWGETPPHMLQPLLVRALEGTGGFRAVITPPLAPAATYELHTEVLDLVQDFGPEPPLLRLSLRAQLRQAEGQRTVAAREIVVQEPMREKSPAGGVAAANLAMQQALRDLSAFVLEHAR
jgi:cholesterol transport system auxiliary component